MNWHIPGYVATAIGAAILGGLFYRGCIADSPVVYETPVPKFAVASRAKFDHLTQILVEDLKVSPNEMKKIVYALDRASGPDYKISEQSLDAALEAALKQAKTPDSSEPLGPIYDAISKSSVVMPEIVEIKP